MEIREGLTFDDVLLVPTYSDITSRSEVDLSVELPKNIKLNHPIIPANMRDITAFDMAEALYKSGGMAIIHRFMPFEDQCDLLLKLVRDNVKNKSPLENVGVSVGIKEEDRQNLTHFVNNIGVKIVCVDVAHGDSKLTVDMVEWISTTFPEIQLIAGNVATANGAERLWRAGADVVKVGIGPGSLCTTRIETGNGVPQLTALMNVAARRNSLAIDREYLKNYLSFPLKPGLNKPMGIIADGGIKNAGDCVKALCFADMVMVGNLFAGSIDTPTQPIIIDGKKYRSYVGSSTHKNTHVEGVRAVVPEKGYARDILNNLTDGISSGCSYQGARNLEDLKDQPEFVKITNAGLKESHPHDVIVK